MNVKKRSLLAIAGLATAGLLATALVTTQAKDQPVDYTSSIKVDGKGEAGQFADLAKIDIGQAITAAQARVQGKVLKAEMEVESGNLVYSVLVRAAQAGGEPQEVIVDAGNGSVL